MSGLQGTNISAKIVPWDSTDTYASHESTYGKGGWREVTTIAERDAIPIPRRTAGMAVYVTSTGTLYTLNADLTSWTMFSGGSGGSSTTYIHEQGIASTEWNITHNLNKFPSVTVVDSAGTEITCSVNYIDNNNCTVTMNSEFKGKAYLN